MILRRFARPLLASAFIAQGVDALRSPAALAQSAEPAVDKAREALPEDVAQRIPAEVETLVRINAAAQIGGGVLLATGKVPRLASVVLAGTLIPSTAVGTDFWNETDPQRRVEQRNAFIKNLGLLGGVLLAAADTEGRPSLAWRGKQKANAATAAVAAAVPFAGKTDDSAAGSAWESLVERTQEGAHVVGEKSAELAHQISDRAPEIAEKVRDRSSEVAQQISDRAPEIAEKVRDRGAEVAHKVSERAPELAEKLSDRGTEVAHQLSDRGTEVAHQFSDRAPEFAEAARERGTGLAEKLRDRGAEVAEVARERAPELAESARDYATQAQDRAADVAKDGRRKWRRKVRS